MTIPLNLLCYFAVCAGYIVYPVWALPALAPAARAGLFLAFCALGTAALFSPLKEAKARFSVPGRAWLAPALSALLLLPLWAPFLNLTIPTGEDEQSHAGAAAWLLGRLSAVSGAPMWTLHLAAWALLAAAAIGLYLLYRRKGPGMDFRPAAVLAVTLPPLAIYFALASHYGLAGRLGSWATIYEYPFLSRFVYAAAYGLFGVHEFLPRLVQAACVCGTGLFLAATAELAGFKASRPVFLLGTVLFPAFFWLSTTPDLEGGTILLFAAATYFYAAFAETGDRGKALAALFTLTVGFFYRQFFVGQALAFALLSAFFALRAAPGPERSAHLRFLRDLWVPLLIGLPYIIISRSTGIKPDIDSNIFSDPSILLLNLKDMPRAIGVPLTALSAVGLAAALVYRRSRTVLAVITVSLCYYLMIGVTIGSGYVRHATPFYLGVAFFALTAVTACAASMRPAAGRALLAAALLLMGARSLLVPHFQYRNLANLGENVFPYDAAAAYLAALPARPSVYAPMEVEPIHFYLAKYGLAGMTWERSVPEDFGPASLVGAFRAGGYDLMLLPYSRAGALSRDYAGAAAALLASGDFAEEKLFDNAGNRLLLLKPAQGKGRGQGK